MKGNELKNLLHRYECVSQEAEVGMIEARCLSGEEKENRELDAELDEQECRDIADELKKANLSRYFKDKYPIIEDIFYNHGL